jgi:hypothetical protein
MTLRHQFWILVVVLVTGCSETEQVITPSSPTVPPRTEADAGVLVTNLALQKGIKLQEYQQPQVSFDAARREWHFFYMLKPPGVPGGHFSITVDETGKTHFRGGA